MGLNPLLMLRFCSTTDATMQTKANATRLGADPERIILGGSSAGGNLVSGKLNFLCLAWELTSHEAAALALRARDEGLEGIIGQVLNIPATCHPRHFPVSKYEFGSYKQNADAPIVSASRMDWFWGEFNHVQCSLVKPAAHKSREIPSHGRASNLRQPSPRPVVQGLAPSS